MQDIKISIIIPTYNRAATIGKTIDSFIAQDYKNWEMIVVDDHSVDNTRDVIDEYHQRDNRVRYISNERKKGAQGARNTGLLHAKAEWVCIFDSDDYAHPEMLKKMVSAIKKNVDVVCCYTNVVDVNSRKVISFFKWQNEGNIHKEILTGEKYVGFDMAIIRKSKLIDIGLLDEDCPSMQEWDTHIRLSKIAQYTTVREQLVDYYVNGADAISTDAQREVKGCIYIFKKHHEEWKNDKNAVDFFVANTYMMIRKNSNCWARLVSVIKLFFFAPCAVNYVIEYRWQYIKRKVKRF